MNAHQRRVARRAGFGGWTVIGVMRSSGSLFDWDDGKSQWVIRLATGPVTRGMFLSVGSNDWRQS
jgi:hypothetical protein